MNSNGRFCLRATHFLRSYFTIQIVGGVEAVQSVLTPLHETVLLTLVDPLKQFEQLLFLLRLLVCSPTQGITGNKKKRGHNSHVMGRESGF